MATLAHLSDTHLGFRAYGRVTSEGTNQREADVLATFEATLEAILAKNPDVVLHTGDVFHQVRPTNHTIVQAQRALIQFQLRRQGKPFLMVGGNHETPRTVDSGSILRLFESIPGLHVAALEPMRIELKELDLEALLVPTRALERDEEIRWEPVLGCSISILGLHGMVSEALPDHAHLSIFETQPDRWTYVGLGDYHVRKKFAANCAYPGSTDFTSSNVWEESTTPKGWIWFDTDLGEIEFVPTQPRLVLDLPRIQADGLSGEELTAKLLQNAEWDESLRPIVRQVVENVSLGCRMGLARREVQALQRRALHYQLDLRKAASESMMSSGEAFGSLETEWAHHIQAQAWESDIEAETLIQLGRDLLRRAGHEIEETEA